MIAWGNTTDRILLLLQTEALTKAEICKKLDLTHDQVSSTLHRLNKATKNFNKRIYICGYTRHISVGKAYIRPIYAFGSYPNAKRNLKPFNQKEKSARSYQKRFAAIKNNSIFNLTVTNKQIIQQNRETKAK